MRLNSLMLLCVLLLASCPRQDEGAATNPAPDSGRSVTAAVPAQTTERAELLTATFKVQGMTCEDCSRAIETKLIGIDGVTTVAADHAAGRAVVQYDPERVSDADIIAAIDSLKFKATLDPSAVAP